MKTNHYYIRFLAVVLLLGGVGCSKKDDAKQQQQLQQEQQDERDAAIGNKAISDMNKTALGRKPPAMDLGPPSDTGNGSTQNPPPLP